MKIISYFLMLFTVYTSFSQKKEAKIKCPKLYENNFSTIGSSIKKIVVNQDTISVTEIRFYCVKSSQLTSKIAFDNFGKWTETTTEFNSNIPQFTYQNTDILKNNKKYTLYTNGKESSNQLYASISITDGLNNDMLSEDSQEKEALINYFANAIREKKVVESKFDVTYFLEKNPQYINRIKQ
jgi:hypothetical protein